MNNLIKRIEDNTKERKKIKDRIDSMIKLSVDDKDGMVTLATSVNDAKTNRLIDEGAVIEGDGSTYAYIEKGTVEKFLNRENVYLENLPEDFVGNINIGHLDHATFPFPVGEWSMSNMHLVDIGDGRHGIDVDITVDDESVFIQELKRLGYDISLSAEFYTHTDWMATESLGVWVIDEILINAYAIVGDGKNVNSNGLQLNAEGESDMKKDEIKASLENENIEDSIDETEDVDTAIEEENADIAADETDDDTTDEDIDADADEETESDEAEEGEETDGEEVNFESVQKYIADLESENTQLKAENAELKKSNKRLNKKLKNELQKKEDFVSKFKTVAEKMSVSEAQPESNVTDSYVFGDGIGE